MNKHELVSKVAQSTGQSKRLTRQILDDLLETLGDTLATGNKIELRGFGSFKIKRRKAQVARNPRTGEKVNVPSRFVPSFKPSRNLLDKVDK